MSNETFTLLSLTPTQFRRFKKAHRLLMAVGLGPTSAADILIRATDERVERERISRDYNAKYAHLPNAPYANAS